MLNGIAEKAFIRLLMILFAGVSVCVGIGILIGWMIWG